MTTGASPSGMSSEGDTVIPGVSATRRTKVVRGSKSATGRTSTDPNGGSVIVIARAGSRCRSTTLIQPKFTWISSSPRGHEAIVNLPLRIRAPSPDRH